MAHEQIEISTAEGNCPSHVFTPGDGRGGPAIIFDMDAGGIRSAVIGMAERLAHAGYVVLLPDMFYRHGPYDLFDPMELFKSDVRAVLGPLMATTSNAIAAKDSAAFLAYLDSRSDVIGDKVGAVGFCMGGGMAIATAGTYPARFAAVASFHGGYLATAASDSPHTYASKLEAELYIAAAANDDSYPPAMARAFEATLTQAGVRYAADIYPAAHGWMKPDFPVYDHEQAERGWRAMLAFFGRILKQHAS